MFSRSVFQFFRERERESFKNLGMKTQKSFFSVGITLYNLERSLSLIRVWSRVRCCSRCRSSSGTSCGSGSSSYRRVCPPLRCRRRPRPAGHRGVQRRDRPQPHRHGAREPHRHHGQRRPPSFAVKVFIRARRRPRGRQRDPDESAGERVGGPPGGRRFQICPPSRGEGEQGLLGAGAVAVVEGLAGAEEVDRLERRRRKRKKKEEKSFFF